jgi:hypothetical protein
MRVNPEGESIKPEDEGDETQGEENGTKVERTIYIDTDTGTHVEEIKIGKRTGTGRHLKHSLLATVASSTINPAIEFCPNQQNL